MKITSCIAGFMASVAVSGVSVSAGVQAASHRLWFNKPGDVYEIRTPWKGNPKNYQQPKQLRGNAWESQGLPIGNGRIGAMVFGGDVRERLALNEISFWSGGENPSMGYEYGPLSGQDQFGCYQPFADFLIEFASSGETSNYTRSLSLDDGIARTSYTKDGVEYKQEVFASFPDQVIVMTCTASSPGRLDAKFMFKPNHTVKMAAQGNELIMAGTLKNGMAFEGRAVVLNQGGQIAAKGAKANVTVTYDNNKPVMKTEKLPYLDLSKADSVTIIISLATDYEMDFKKNWKGMSPGQRNKNYLDKVAGKSPNELKSVHIKNHKSLFDRVKLDLGKTDPSVASLPTDERIKAYQNKPEDPELEETLFQYGRYLLMSSSRPGTLPANLQGLWNDHVQQAWACDYHSDINIQMNYWLAGPTNLQECQTSLLDFFTAMTLPSIQATKKTFKNQGGTPARGWTVAFSQNPFGGHGWAWNIPGSSWYACHMWEHYAFTQDNTYLRKQAYPMMKQICQFWEDHLKELGEHGKGLVSNGKELDVSQYPELKDIKKGTLVAPDTWSPEHGPREDGVAHDQQLVRNLFDMTITAAEILDVDREWAEQLARKRDLLADHRIGREGNLQEWMIDRDPRTAHRHTSHLLAVYPCNQISVEKTPELAAAAKKSLLWRGTSGDSRRSWTWPWRTALWARFQEGNKAHEMISSLIQYNMLDNMLTTHPPMQMDGNFGITAGMAEMLLQSHNPGEISLLPALPAAWPSGSVKGLKARGNITVNFEWKNGKVTKKELFSPSSQKVKVITNGNVETVETGKLPPVR